MVKLLQMRFIPKTIAAVLAGLISVAGAAVITAYGSKAQGNIDTALNIEPGVSILYNGLPAQLYGDAPCPRTANRDISCLSFSPNKTTAQGTILQGGVVHHLTLHATKNPTKAGQYLVLDEQGTVIYRASGFDLRKLI